MVSHNILCIKVWYSCLILHSHGFRITLLELSWHCLSAYLFIAECNNVKQEYFTRVINDNIWHLKIELLRNFYNSISIFAKWLAEASGHFWANYCLNMKRQKSWILKTLKLVFCLDFYNSSFLHTSLGNNILLFHTI